MKHIIIGIFALMISLLMPNAKAYTYQDCMTFVQPALGNDSYVHCLQNPAVYAYLYVYYNVDFYSDGTLLKTESVPRGGNATAPSVPTNIGFTFNGWDRSFTNVQSHLTVNANWIQTHRITFRSHDGVTLSVQDVEKGHDAIPPTPPVFTGHTFAGWSGRYTNVNQDSTVIAMYTPMTYQVTFFHLDGTVYQSASVSYNGSVSPPVAPVLAGKTFVQWSQSTSLVRSNLSVYPQYETTRYQVRFLDNGEVLKEQTVEHGNDATPPIMNKTGHQFIGWDGSYTNMTSSIDLVARWVKDLFDVYFYHPSGSVVSHQSVAYEEAAVAPQYSVADGYELVGWDQDFTSVTSLLHVYPIESVASYDVYFMDGETLLFHETVEHGNGCGSYHPVKVGHTFVGWNSSCNVVTQPLTIQAQFEPIYYTVRFYDFLNFVTSEQQVAHGTSAEEPSTTFPNYRFMGWNQSFDQVTSDLSIKPLGELRTYQAVFKNYDGVTLCTRIVSYDEEVTCPAPTRTGYQFTGWSESLKIQNDTTIFATFDVLRFQVDFYVENVLTKSEMVPYNFDATPPQINLQEFDFTRWQGSYQKVTSPQRVDAVLQRREYVVVFKIGDLTVKEMSVPHGQNAIPPLSPHKQGHQFVRWIEDYENVTTHRAIHAEFEPLMYTVTFMVEGSPYATLQAAYQTKVTPPEITVEGHDILGWQGELDNIEQDTMVYAILKVKSYPVVFIEEGNPISEQMVRHGEAAVAPHDGPWDQPFQRVTSAMTIQRQRLQDSPIIDDVIELPSEPLNDVMNATLNIKDTTYRYSFDIDLRDYEIIDLTLGGQSIIDHSILRFQTTNFLRREVRWLEIENPNHAPIEFGLRHMEDYSTLAVQPIEVVPSQGVNLQWMWLTIVSFLERFLR